MRPLPPGRSWSLLIVILLGSCSADPVDHTSKSKKTTPKETQSGANITLSESSDPGSIEYIQRTGDRYSRVRIHNNGRSVAVLDDTYGKYEKESPPSMSDSGNIVVLHQIDSGTVEDPNGGLRAHERYYCTFVDTRDGCVLERRTGEFCSGSWTAGNQWSDF